MGELFKKLENYGNSYAYPFHMPGHKRQKTAYFNPYKIDITEIEGFDNLHHAEGILMNAQKRAAKLYGSEETHFLVNGSTGGILSAVSACAKKHVLIARNCHKAVYHAALLRNLETYYLYPEMQEEFWLNGGINPLDVEKALVEHPEVEAVLITSPTFDGVVSDVGAIAEIAHRFGKPLIVDEAHGAHFGFSDYFPKSSVQMGADIVIHSLHKTLPAYTQTALLHVNGTLVDRERLRMLLQMYQTSSPSYILMAGIDECVRYVSEQGEQEFARFAERLEAFYEHAGELKNICLVNRSIAGKNSIYDFDRSKLIFSVKGFGIAGNELQDMLRRNYNLELEMAAGTYVLALTSINDTARGFERLFQGIKNIDGQIGRFSSGQYSEREQNEELPIRDTVIRNESFCSLNEAFEAPKYRVPLAESEGHVSGEFLYLYPPGIPIAAPGERISRELLQRIFGYKSRNFNLEGLSDYTGETIEVLKESKTLL